MAEEESQERLLQEQTGFDAEKVIQKSRIKFYRSFLMDLMQFLSNHSILNETKNVIGSGQSSGFATWKEAVGAGKRGDMQKAFFQQVYTIVEQVPCGKVATYGQIALLSGSPRAARIVGCAMEKAPEGLPCHRILYKDGGLCKGDCFGGPQAQRQLLEQEGISFLPDGRADLSVHLWEGLETGN